jgi:hypothetical protein
MNSLAGRRVRFVLSTDLRDEQGGNKERKSSATYLGQKKSCLSLIIRPSLATPPPQAAPAVMRAGCRE